MGPPGAGKGTQADLIAGEYGICHISTGEMFRQAARENTPIGRAASGFMERGLLVPDDVTIEMVRQRLSKPDCRKGFVLDGFPRNVFQAQELDHIGDEIGKPVQVALSIEVSRDILLQRSAGRRVCTCGASYHIRHSPPKVAERCDICGGRLMVREDDRPDVVLNRLQTYTEQTEPVKCYYRQCGRLREIDGSEDVQSVRNLIRAVLEMFK
jgi:adenylate kinase